MLKAFGQTQDAVNEVAKSTVGVIERPGAAARPGRLEEEFGLKFSASCEVIMPGFAGEAILKVTLGYNMVARPAIVLSAVALTARASDEPLRASSAGSS